MYQKFLREVGGDHNFLSCPYLLDNKFEVLHSVIALDKVDLDCTENVKAKPTGNDLDFITYSKTIKFACK